jgi:hypothetical protein
MTRARGAKFTAEIEHDGRNFLAILHWKRGHGGPREIGDTTEEAVRFRLRGLDASVEFYAEGAVPRRRVTR